MVAYDEPGVVPIKRTLQKIDYQNQVCKELEVSIEGLKMTSCSYSAQAGFFFFVSPPATRHVKCVYNVISRKRTLVWQVLQVCFLKVCVCVCTKVLLGLRIRWLF